MRVGVGIVFASLLALGGFSLVLPAGAAGPDSDQIIKYYRKKANVPPAQKVAVTGMKDSEIKGAKAGALEIGDTPNTKKVNFVASADGRYVVFGDTEDVTVDPSKAVMAKINLKGEPSRGPANAKVTLVEFSDFQCPFCSKGYTTIETQVLKDYGDKVKFYYKNYPLPFHPWAQPGAIAAECAKQQKPEAFWAVYKGLFEQQKDITADNVKDKAWALAADQKIDKAKFDDCFDNKKTLDKVKADQAEGSSVGVTGTPSFVINGRLIVGAQPYEAFKNIIDDELASAK
jgi:protein-disulfide isomerase